MVALDDGDPPLLGRSIADAPGSAFFTWFHFEPAELPNRFRPSGAAFHDMVSLDVGTAEQAAGAHPFVTERASNQIVRMNLRLARRFIDDARNGVFARDVMKSFLRAAMPPRVLRAIPTMTDTLAAIEDISQSGATVIVGGFNTLLRRAPAVHTLAYDVYLGRAAVWSGSSAADHGVTIQMSNDASTGDTVLVTAIAVQGLPQ